MSKFPRIASSAAGLTLALVASSAFAFYGTEIKNYRPNPWLESRNAAQAQSSAGATASAPQSGRQASNDALARFFREADRASHIGL